MTINIKKVTITKNKKIIVLVASIIIICISIFAIYSMLSPKTEKEQITLYKYLIDGGSSYQVHIQENQLYEGTTMEEGVVYPRNIFEKLQVNFYAEFLGLSDTNADISAAYSIDVKVRGVQNLKEETTILYEKVFPISEKTGLSFKNEGSIGEEVDITFDQYEAFIEGVATEVLSDHSSEAELVFSGIFTVETQYGSKEEEFIYSIPLPLYSNVFIIDKPADIETSGTITQTQELGKSVEIPLIIICLVVILAMILFIIYILKFTLPPTEAESLIIEFKTIIRKYGSRIVRGNKGSNLTYEIAFEINNIDGMVKISDEYNIPIFYIADEKGFPEENKLFIPAKDICYTYYLGCKLIKS